MDNAFSVAPATEAQMDQMHFYLKALDAGQEGVTRDRLRVFYPQAPWGEILAALNGLVDAGRARTIRVGSTGQFEAYVWL